jgi:hypothetical protein
MNKEIAIQILKQVSLSPNVLLSKTDHLSLEQAINFIENEFKKESIEQNNTELVNSL